MKRHILQSSIAALSLLAAVATADAQTITPGTRLPSESEQYTLQLINQARSSANGLAILQRLVTNNLANITASSTGTSGTGTPWSANFWTSNIPDVANNMNFFRVHPGDLKKQFQDLVIPNYPLYWHPNLGNVASGYNQIVINNAGAGPGFPHTLAPYADTSTFAAYAKRYTDGGYGPLGDLSSLAENVAPNSTQNPLFRFASFMIDWGSTPNGIQNPPGHRTTILSNTLTEIGISSRNGWGATSTTETQELGARFSKPVNLTGIVYRDIDRNGFFTPSYGESFNGAVVVATAANGTSFRGTTYSTGGYAFAIPTPGTYNVGVHGRFGFLNLGPVTVGNTSIQRDGVIPQGSVQTDFNDDFRPDVLFENTTTRETSVRFLDGSTQTGSATGLTIPTGWTLAGVADMSRNSFADYILFNPTTRQIEVRYALRGAQSGVGTGPVLPAGQTLAAVADINRDGFQDFITINASTRATTVHFLNVLNVTSTTAGPTIPAGFLVTGLGDFNRDGFSDLVIFNPSNGATQVWNLNGSAAVLSTAAGPTIPAGWTLAGPMLITNDSKPDYLLFNKTTGATSFWQLDGLNYQSASRGPIAPAGWTLAGPRAQ